MWLYQMFETHTAQVCDGRMKLVERYPGRQTFDGFILRSIEIPLWHNQVNTPGSRYYPLEDDILRTELHELRTSTNPYGHERAREWRECFEPCPV